MRRDQPVDQVGLVGVATRTNQFARQFAVNWLEIDVVFAAAIAFDREFHGRGFRRMTLVFEMSSLVAVLAMD